MIIYTPLAGTIQSIGNGQLQGAWDGEVERLVQLWLDDYGRLHRTTDIVETTAANFSYLFDIGAQRLIAAWGVSAGATLASEMPVGWRDTRQARGCATIEVTRFRTPSAVRRTSTWCRNLEP